MYYHIDLSENQQMLILLETLLTKPPVFESKILIYTLIFKNERFIGFKIRHLI